MMGKKPVCCETCAAWARQAPGRKKILTSFCPRISQRTSWAFWCKNYTEYKEADHE